MERYPNLYKHRIYYVDSEEQTNFYLDFFSVPKIIGVDTETISLDPHTGKLRLVQIADKNTRVVFDTWKIGETAKRSLAEFLSNQDKLKVFHMAKFDIKFLKLHLGVKEFERVACTNILSKLLSFGNMTHSHSLKSVLEKYLSVDISKEEQQSDWSQENLTENQIIYAATDARYLVELYEILLMMIKKNAMQQIMAIEMDCIEATAEMELNGIHLDWDMWTKRTDNDEKRCHETEWEIYEMFDETGKQPTLFGEPQVFNINSTFQLRAKFRELGIKIPMLRGTDGSERETMGKDQLKDIQDQHPVIPKLILQKELHKAYTSYGRNWAHCINAKTGRVHANYNQIGAMTGRFSTGDDVKTGKMDPPLLGIPRKTEYRSCFTAEPGNVLVWGDYSQIELRILAEYSGDRNLIQAFVEGRDLHAWSAHLIFRVPYENVPKEKRDLAKDLNYGVVYGVGARKFALKTGIEVKESQGLIKRFFGVYPQLDNYLTGAAYKAVTRRQIRTLGGRLIKFQFDENDSNQVSATQRNGKNTPIQGTGADMLKVAIRNVYDYTRGLPIMLCHAVHDEGIVEGPKELESMMSEILVDAMMAAGQRFLKHVPVKVDIKTGFHWKK